MIEIISDPTEEQFKIYETWSPTEIGVNSAPTFSNSGDEYIVTIADLTNISKFSTFKFDYTLETPNRYLKSYYRLSRDSQAWTDWYELPSTITEFPPFTEKDTLYLDIKFVRFGSSTQGVIKLLNWSIEGLKLRNQYDGESTIILSPTNNQVIIKPPFIYKVFKIDDIGLFRISKDSRNDTQISMTRSYPIPGCEFF
jgi:hypothetical protein